MTTETNHIDTAAAIVAAYVSRNVVQASELPALIASVHGALKAAAEPPAAAPEPLIPIVPIKKTVTDTHIISLEDGKPYKSLRRHLNARGMTFEAYKAKWGLPENYPAVAPAYAAKRSELAKSIGLGRTRNRDLKAVA